MDEELIKRAQDGDADAFEALLDAHYDFIHSVAWRWCGNRDEAEDITQEVCIRLARILPSFKGDSGFRTWVYRITLNIVYDFHRKTAREQRKTKAFFEEQCFTHSMPEDDISDKLWAAVRKLPQQLRDAVLLVHGEGVNHARAGEILNCAESTISWRLMEARKKLKILVNEGSSS